MLPLAISNHIKATSRLATGVDSGVQGIRNASYIIGKTVKTVKIRSSCRAGITGINNKIVKRRKKGKLGFIQSLYSAAKR